MMFKQLIAIALVAVVAAADDKTEKKEEPKKSEFETVVDKLPTIHFTAKPGPLMPGLYKLIMGDSK